jgi:phage-related protein
VKEQVLRAATRPFAGFSPQLTSRDQPAQGDTEEALCISIKHREHHRPPLCLSIGDGLFELRVGHKNIARGLWFFQRGQRIIVVHCFVKKSQKTPADELDLARKRMADYLARFKEYER